MTPLQTEFTQVITELDEAVRKWPYQSPLNEIRDQGFDPNLIYLTAPLIEELKKLAHFLKNYLQNDIEILFSVFPEFLLGEVNAQIREAKGLLTNISGNCRQQPPNTDDGRGARLPRQVEQATKRAREIFTGIYTFLPQPTTENDKIARIIDELKRENSSYKIELEALREEAKAVLSNLQKASAKTGVTQHIDVFTNESKSNYKHSLVWLAATVLFVGLSGIYALILLNGFLKIRIFGQSFFYELHLIALPKGGELSAVYIIPLVLSKILIFSVLSFATIWSARNYRALMHNYIVNKHRANALTTFEAFRDAATDDMTKNAVLTKVTNSIFGHVQTGFSSVDYDQMPNNQIIEIVKSLGQSGK